MGKKPQGRKYDKPACRGRHTYVQARKYRLAAPGIVEIKNGGDEPPGIGVVHYVHVRRKGIASVRQIALEAKLLADWLLGPIGTDLERLPIVSQASDENLADLGFHVFPVEADAQLHEAE